MVRYRAGNGLQALTQQQGRQKTVHVVEPRE